MHHRTPRSPILWLLFPCLAACGASSQSDATGNSADQPEASGNGGAAGTSVITGSGGSSQGGAAGAANGGAAGTSSPQGGGAGTTAGAAGKGESGAAGSGGKGGAAGGQNLSGASGASGSSGSPALGGQGGTDAGGQGGTDAGAAGTAASGAAGEGGGGAAGTAASGAAGTQSSGAAGTQSSGAAGTQSSGAAGTGASGAAGTGASGAAGMANSNGGQAGAGGSAEAGGSSGEDGGGGGGPAGGAGGAVACAGDLCGAACVDLAHDPAHCGSCDHACGASMACHAGLCAAGPCAPGLMRCGAECVDLVADDQNCGGCGVACPVGLFCSGGQCGAGCVGGTTRCGAECVDLGSSPQDCGACDHACAASERCADGACAPGCAAGTTLCQGFCTDTKTSRLHCGGCGLNCGPGESCVGGVCGPFCDSATTDCDGDGWTVAQGDCCDQPGQCGKVNPALVNPGAMEIAGNGADDNCNGLADLADSDALLACDGGLPSTPTSSDQLARALGICQTTTDSPATPSERRWGLLETLVLRADGSPLGDPRAVSIRPSFGQISPATVEGSRLVVLSTGIAADETQTLPGPNGGGPSGLVSSMHLPASVVSLADEGQPRSIHDWFSTANLPLKPAGALPTAPGCVGSQINEARDSVMLVLRLRAPTNAQAFSLRAYFLSAEYPKSVCTTYNDQLVALVRTPAAPSAPNPPDGNLMTYLHGGQDWPVGINIARGTPLFSVCDPQASKPQCWVNSNVSPDSCSLGPAQLAGTGFEAAPGGCATGGGSYWLTTRGNVVPGQEVEIRIALWDVGDSSFDSLVLLDGFRWLTGPVTPGTTP